MIELSHISKTYVAPDKKVIALEDVNIRVEAGQVYGIVGYSGAGKSTLVRCINFLERPDAGSIRIDGFGTLEVRGGNAFYTPESGGQSVRLTEKHLKALRRDLGMIFQHFNLLDRDTVFDNIAYPLKYTGRSKEEIRSRVLELLELVDLSDKVNVLLSDEATSALDPDATESILKLLKDLNRKLNLTIVLITHEMAVVKSICDRVAVMENGHVVEEGDVYEVFSNPQQAITKKFVNTSSGMGQINRLIRENSSVLNSDATLVQCTFSKDSVGEALVSDVSRRFGVNVNIILGNVELLRGNPLGGLVVLIDGEEEKRRAVIEYLRAHDVRVEVIERG